MNPIILGLIAWLLFPKKKKTPSGESASRYDSIIYKTVLSEKLSSQLAKIIVAQAKFESANFSSNVFKKTKNAFGYKCFPGSKFQSGCVAPSPEGDKYASYKSVSDSAREVVAWLKRREANKQFPNNWKIADLTTPQRYAEALKRNSFGAFYGGTSEAYTRGIQKYL